MICPLNTLISELDVTLVAVSGPSVVSPVTSKSPLIVNPVIVLIVDVKSPNPPFLDIVNVFASLYVNPVTNVFVSTGTVTSTLMTSPTVDIVVLLPPLSVLKYKSVPDFPLNTSLAPPLLTPFSTLESNCVCTLPL